MVMVPSFTWIDYTLLVIVGVSIFTGFARGLIREIIAFITFIVAIIAAALLASPLAISLTSTAIVQQSSEKQEPSYIALGLSFALIFVAVIAIGAILGFIINLIFHSGILDLANRLSGAIFGFFRGCLLSIVVVFLVQLTSFSDARAWQQSQLVSALQPVIVWLGQVVSPELVNVGKEWIKNNQSSLINKRTDD